MPRDSRRELQDLGPINGRAHGGIWHPVPELQGPLVVGLRIRQAEHRVGGKPRTNRCLEGLRQIMRGMPVVGELGDPGQIAVRSGLMGQGAGECSMQPGALTGKQFCVDRLLNEGVTKRILVFLAGDLRDQDLACDRFSEPRVEGRLRRWP